MFNVDFEFNEFKIQSIKKDDIINAYKWFNKNENKYNNETKFNDFFYRFLEYYIGENEVFLKIVFKQKLVGILRGRIEFKNCNEFWILYFEMNDDLKQNDFDSKVIYKIMEYFKSYGIFNFYVVALKNENNSLRFWHKNGFNIQRICTNIIDQKKDNKTFILQSNVDNIKMYN